MILFSVLLLNKNSHNCVNERKQCCSKSAITAMQCNSYSSTIPARICFTANANAAKPIMTIRLVRAPPNKTLGLSLPFSGTPIRPAAASAAFADVESTPTLLQLALRSSHSRRRWFSRISCHSNSITHRDKYGTPQQNTSFHKSSNFTICRISASCSTCSTCPILIQ